MKKRGYFSFVVKKLIAALLIGAVIFGISFNLLERMYNSALGNGFDKRAEYYRKTMQRYDEGSVGTVMVNVIANILQCDYLRIAKVGDDGSFNNIYETDYDGIPIEINGIQHWYYITDNEELLAKGKITDRIKDHDWTMEYKKCDEIRGIGNVSDSRIINGYDLCSMNEGFYANVLFAIPVEFSTLMQYKNTVIKTYYEDKDTLHPGRVTLEMAINSKEIGKGWDFTDPAKADLYKDADLLEDYSGGMLVFRRCVRPDDFLAGHGKVFLAKNIDEYRNKDAVDGQNGLKNAFGEPVTGDYNYGYSDIYEINGNKYLIAFALKTAPFGTFAKPFLILYAIVLFVLGVAIACLSSIKPYRQYKRAYENNIFKNNLIDSLAHNMKTPLQILGGYAENLKDVSESAEKDRYAEQILAKTNEMNKDIEAILKTAENNDRKLVKCSVHECIEEAAAKAGAEVSVKGDMQLKMDKEYFKTALLCLIDNANKYKADDARIDVEISCKGISIKNKTGSDKFTPGTGIAIAGRILEQHKLHLNTTLKDGVFEALIGKRPAKK